MAAPIEIPFPLTSRPGATPQESAGRLINVYGEPLGDTGPAKQVWRRTPGLSSFATTGFTGFRGAILVANLVFVALANKLVTVDANGAVTLVGTLPGTKRVTFARNLQSPTPSIICVDPDNGAFLVTASTINTYTGGGNLPQPNSVCGGDAYFFFSIGDNRMFAAGPNSTALNALTFASAQAKANGILIRLVNYKGMLFAFTTGWTEIWNDTVQPFPTFPYSRFKVNDRGLLGPNAVAGWEEGFGNLMWVGDDFSVQRLNGLDPDKISTPDIDRMIKAVSDPNTLEASCYTHSGHSFWALSSPTWSWEFNLNTQQWNERDSFLQSNVNPVFQRWRATGSVNAFGKWLVGDFQTGNLGMIDDTVYTEFGAMQRFRMESGPVVNFPNRSIVARADFDFVTGVGLSSGALPNIVSPSVAISWSNDDGVRWGNPLIRALGPQAASLYRPFVLNTGQAGAQGRRWRLDVTDPVYVGFQGGTQSADPRAN